MRLITLAVVGLLLGAAAHAQLAPNAPADQPQPVMDTQLAAFEKAVAPYITKAKQTYPAAKKRYLAGLPAGETFFVMTRLRDANGLTEQVFIHVSKIEGDRISGTIANQLQLVTGYREGQSYSFKEAELLDWLIAKPDGSEEGNVVGKFLDTYHP